MQRQFLTQICPVPFFHGGRLAGATPLRCGGSEQAHNLVVLKVDVNAEECWSGGKAGHRANLSECGQGIPWFEQGLIKWEISGLFPSLEGGGGGGKLNRQGGKLYKKICILMYPLPLV